MSPLLFLALAAPTAPVHPPATLHVGDRAPEMRVVRWLKGRPQTDLRNGRVHVVEFWATWCGPCKVGMPHLSELAKRYGHRVVFTGVDASERKDDVAKAAAFVRQAGPMMGYNVAYATPKGPMTTDWMHAAGQYGIPCAFVVDRRGRIGWIGHPLMGLEQALDLALQNRLTPQAATRIGKEWDARLARGEKRDKAVAAAEKAGRIDAALGLNDRQLADWPFAAPDIAATKYGLLTAKGAAKASAYADELLREKANAPYILRTVAAAITDPASDVKGPRDYRLAWTLVERSQRCLAPTAASNGVLARAESGLGDPRKAAKLQASVVNALSQSLRTTNFGTGPDAKQEKAESEKALADAWTTLARYEKDTKASYQSKR